MYEGPVGRKKISTVLRTEEDRVWEDLAGAVEAGFIDTLEEANERFLEWRGAAIGRVVLPNAVTTGTIKRY